jgi:hypothetical protein
VCEAREEVKGLHRAELGGGVGVDNGGLGSWVPVVLPCGRGGDVEVAVGYEPATETKFPMEIQLGETEEQRRRERGWGESERGEDGYVGEILIL